MVVKVLILLLIILLTQFYKNRWWIWGLILCSLFYYYFYKNFLFILVYIWALSWILLKHRNWIFIEIFNYSKYFFIIFVNILINIFKKWF